MKICIVGSVTTDCYWGGVASFGEGLAEAFLATGKDVTIISMQEGEKFLETKFR